MTIAMWRQSALCNLCRFHENTGSMNDPVIFPLEMMRIGFVPGSLVKLYNLSELSLGNNNFDGEIKLNLQRQCMTWTITIY